MRKISKTYHGYVWDHTRKREIGPLYSILLLNEDQPTLLETVEKFSSEIEKIEAEINYMHNVKPIKVFNSCRVSLFNLKVYISLENANGQVSIIYWNNELGDYDYKENIPNLDFESYNFIRYKDFYNPKTNKYERFYTTEEEPSYCFMKEIPYYFIDESFKLEKASIPPYYLEEQSYVYTDVSREGISMYALLVGKFEPEYEWRRVGKDYCDNDAINLWVAKDNSKAYKRDSNGNMIPFELK